MEEKSSHDAEEEVGALGACFREREARSLFNEEQGKKLLLSVEQENNLERMSF